MSVEDHIREATAQAKVKAALAEARADNWLGRLAAKSYSAFVVYPVLVLALVGVLALIKLVFGK